MLKKNGVYEMINKNILIILVSLFVLLSGCNSEKEVNKIREEAYNQGYYDALDCVKSQKGYAIKAANICENK